MSLKLMRDVFINWYGICIEQNCLKNCIKNINK